MNAPSCRRVRPSSSPAQTDLFASLSGLPEGFRYCPSILSPEDEEALARELANFPSKPFDFHGYLANRRVVCFDYNYDYERRAVVEAAPFPSFLLTLRRKVAETFDRPADAFSQVLINEYRPGAGIGWHRDKAQFDEVVGCLCLRPATYDFAGRRATLGTEPRLRSSRAQLISYRGPPAGSGSTAFRPSIVFVIQSPCGRSLETTSTNSPPRLA